MSIEIRPIKTEAEYRAAEDLQRVVWGMADGVEVVPYHLLLTAQENGGVVLGAFDRVQGTEQLVGFVFGFAGLSPEGHVKHCSHMAGVVPGRQDKNIGYRLKLAQREHVLAQGIDLATWTFDPLQSRNAYFNFHKLGVVCKTYRRNLYGELADALSGGMPTDRFKVEWHVGTDLVAGRLSGAWPGFSLPALLAQGVPLLEGVLRDDLLCPPEAMPRFEGQHVLVQIPSSIAAIKARDMGAARAWVDHMRAVFETAFALGYVAVDCLYEEGQSVYLLERGGLS